MVSVIVSNPFLPLAQKNKNHKDPAPAVPKPSGKQLIYEMGTSRWENRQVQDPSSVIILF